MNYNIYDLKIKEICPSKHNPRRINPDDPTIVELAKSMDEAGLLTPVTCRPHPAKDPKIKYELLAGERRFRAAMKLGWKTIPAFVRDVDDEKAVEITVLENLQREELSPFEEARGCQTLLDGGWDVETVASKIGKSEAWVRRRAGLLNLSERWRAAANGDAEDIDIDLIHWTPGHFDIIAGLDKKTQDELFDALPCNIKRWTIAELRDWIANEQRDVNKAPWDINDPDFIPDVGSCALCDNRTGEHPFLFDDVSGGKKSKKDLCLNPKCWAKKFSAHLKNQVTALKKKHKKLVVASDGAPFSLCESVGSHHRLYQFEKCKKTDPGAVPVVTLSPVGLSKKVTWMRNENIAQKKTEELTADEKAARLELKQKRRALEMFANVVREITWSQFAESYPDAIFAVHALVATFGLPWCLDGGYVIDPHNLATPVDWPKREEYGVWDDRPWGIFHQLRTSTPGERYEVLWAGLRDIFADRLEAASENDNWVSGGINEALHLGEILGLNFHEFLADAKKAVSGDKK